MPGRLPGKGEGPGGAGAGAQRQPGGHADAAHAAGRGAGHAEAAARKVVLSCPCSAQLDGGGNAQVRPCKMVNRHVQDDGAAAPCDLTTVMWQHIDDIQMALLWRQVSDQASMHAGSLSRTQIVRCQHSSCRTRMRMFSMWSSRCGSRARRCRRPRHRSTNMCLHSRQDSTHPGKRGV